MTFETFSDFKHIYSITKITNDKFKNLRDKYNQLYATPGMRSTKIKFFYDISNKSVFIQVPISENIKYPVQLKLNNPVIEIDMIKGMVPDDCAGTDLFIITYFKVDKPRAIYNISKSMLNIYSTMFPEKNKFGFRLSYDVESTQPGILNRKLFYLFKNLKKTIFNRMIIDSVVSSKLIEQLHDHFNGDESEMMEFRSHQIEHCKTIDSYHYDIDLDDLWKSSGAVYSKLDINTFIF